MSLELTDADRAAIRGVRAPQYMRDTNEAEETLGRIYLAGLRAGLERAAKVCGECDVIDAPAAYSAGVRHCVATIRALKE